MKNYKVLIATLLICITAIIVVPKINTDKLSGSNTDSAFIVKGTNTKEATTTPVYMTPGTATTTLTVSKDKGSVPALFIAFTASTSPAILNWDYQFSNNGIDWYEEDDTIEALARFDHASTTVAHVWQPGSTTASTSYKTLGMPNTSSKFMRVVFSLPIGTVNSSLYSEIIK